MFDPLILGKNIRRYREKCNMTQNDLAQRLYVSFQAVSAWERGVAVPDLENAVKLAELFKVKLDIMLRDEYNSLFAAIDGGGTKTEFVLFDELGNVRNRTVTTGSNPNDIGIEKALEVLRRGLDKLLDNTCPRGIFAGIAGCSSSNYKQVIAETLSKEYCTSSFADTDAVNVLSMGKDIRNTAAVICGTGSVVFVRKDYRLTRIGGWGYLFDRAGSGYDIGNDAIRHALAVNDRLEEPTLLSRSTAEKLGGNPWDSISTLYQKGRPYIASFAPVVTECADKGDGVAVKILEENAKRLATLIKTARREHNAPSEIVGAGGFLKHEGFRGMVEDYSDTRIFVPETPPIFGACIECLRLSEVKPSEEFKKNFLETIKTFE